jgi:hypothetical protein
VALSNNRSLAIDGNDEGSVVHAMVKDMNGSRWMVNSQSNRREEAGTIATIMSRVDTWGFTNSELC